MIQTQDLTKTYQYLFEVDANLDNLVKKIELLSYINPINVEKEKQRFFASRYLYNPDFKYPKLKFNPFTLQRLFFSQQLEKIEDEQIASLYEDVIYYYANVIQCINTIGQGKEFYYNSLRAYGTPNERDVENAKFILHFEDDETEHNSNKIFTAEEAKNYFEAFSAQYNFPLHIKLATHITAEAMVSNSTQTLLIKKNATFNENQLKTLANHEIGVHLVTTFNGINHPLKIFSNGFPKNVETQEGLAVFSEYMSGALTLKRLKELAYRVIAVNSLLKGYSFSDTFDLIHNQYKLNKDDAFKITLRVHRGGGFTKDHLYLSGLKKIYNYYTNNEDLKVLLTGKVNMKYTPIIKKMQQLGLANKGDYYTKSFLQNENTNNRIDFILQNLK